MRTRTRPVIASPDPSASARDLLPPFDLAMAEHVAAVLWVMPDAMLDAVCRQRAARARPVAMPSGETPAEHAASSTGDVELLTVTAC